MSKARNLATLLSSDGSVKTTKYADSVGGQSDFVASGTLPNGSPVILNSNGTVSAIGQVSTDVNLTHDWIEGSYTTLTNDGIGSTLDSDFNPNIANQFAVVYADANNSNYTTVAVGTVSGTTITFGTHVVAVSGTNNNYAMIKFNPNRANQFLIFYQDNSLSYQRHVKAGVITGTTPSFPYSSLAVTTSYGETSDRNCMQFDPFTTDQFIIFYENGGYTGPLEIRVCSVNSAGLISLGSVVEVESTYTGSKYPHINFDVNTANKFLVTYKDSNSDAVAKSGTLSGTSITFGTRFIFDTGNPFYIVTASEKGRSGKFLVGWYDQPNSGRTQLRVLTVTGTTVTAGAVTNFANGPFYTTAMLNDPNDGNKFVFHGQKGGTAPYPHHAYVVSVSSGDVVTAAGGPYDMSDGSYGGRQQSTLCFDPNNNGKVIFGSGIQFSYASTGWKFAVSQLGGIYQELASSLTATNFIGISSAAYADTETATLNLQGGTATNLSGLTVGATYYVQGDNTLGTSAASPSVEAGKALSTTSILLKGI
jgi:hypothetical protein